MRIMNTVCFILVVLVISCHGDKTVSGTCTPNLENALFEDLLRMMMKIKGTGKGTNHQDETFSAFAASLTAAKTLGTGEIVKFDKVWTNVNNDYDPSTGIYTAPKPGLFQFSCTVMTQNGKTLHVFLGKNDTKTVAVYPGQTGFNMGTLNMVLELRKGDKVYIKQGRSGKEIYSESINNFTLGNLYTSAVVLSVPAGIISSEVRNEFADSDSDDDPILMILARQQLHRDIGRRYHVDRSDKMCSICQNGRIEDDCNYILVCPV